MLSIYEFGERLLETEDLDPVYCGLVRAFLPQDQLFRWLLAYWCFYHVGVASRISEATGDDYWVKMREAAVNSGLRFPRGAERRHFRGQKCVNAIDNLGLAWSFNIPHINDSKTIMDMVLQWPMFGPWIAFKAADMIDRCVNPIGFDQSLGLIYKEPKAALYSLVDREGLTIEEHWAMLLDHFKQFKAPPGYDRSCSAQEGETIACKWRSYTGGHYWVGKDIKEQRKALIGWGETATKIFEAYPKEVK